MRAMRLFSSCVLLFSPLFLSSNIFVTRSSWVANLCVMASRASLACFQPAFTRSRALACSAFRLSAAAASASLFSLKRSSRSLAKASRSLAAASWAVERASARSPSRRSWAPSRSRMRSTMAFCLLNSSCNSPRSAMSEVKIASTSASVMASAVSSKSFSNWRCFRSQNSSVRAKASPRAVLAPLFSFSLSPPLSVRASLAESAPLLRTFGSKGLFEKSLC
mmetsp:Transcript_47494/g.119693  ORF Transcript_47494/g.119693 Transcript_47494/m.119693 type:complete len:221 (+) Transcript_47494:889-1551(+)